MSDANTTALRYAKESNFAASPGGVRAGATVDFTGLPIANDTVTVNGTVYTFKASVGATANEVKIGADATATAANLAAAINATASGAGVQFGSATVAHTTVSATSALGVVTLEYRTLGTAGNSATLAESATNLTVSGANFTGGANTIYATGQALRFNSSTLNPAKVVVQSDEIRSDRTTYDLVKVGIGGSGETEHELVCGDFDELMASAMMNSVESGSNVQSMAIAGGVLTPAGNFNSVPGVRGAKYVKLSQRTGGINNGIFRVISVTGDALTLDGVVDQAGGGADQIEWYYVRQGILLESYVVEEKITGADTYLTMLGMCVNTMALSMEPRAKAMLRFGFLGYGLDDQGGEGARAESAFMSVTDPTENPILNSTSHVVQLLRGGVDSGAIIERLEFNINNNLRERLAISREGTLEPGAGLAVFTGLARLYFDDRDEYNKFVNHVGESLEFTMEDDDGRIQNYYFPKVRYMDGNPSIPGINQDVYLPLAWQAVRGLGHDGTSRFQAQIDMLEP